MVDVGGDDGPAARHLVAHELGLHALAQRHELHLGRDLAPAGVVHLGDGAPGRGPQAGTQGALAGEPLGARPAGTLAARPSSRSVGDAAGVVLDVVPLVDPGRPQRGSPALGSLPGPLVS